MLEGKLLQAGLSVYEAKVYIALLETGKTTLGKLAKKANFGHVTCLYNLRYLMEKGLVIRQRENIKNYYYIRNPKHGARKYLQTLRDEYEKKETAINESIEGAEIKYADLTSKQEVKFFEGENASPGLQLEIQNTEFSEMYEFTNLDAAWGAVSRKLREAHKKDLRKRKFLFYCVYTTEKGEILQRKWKRTKRYYIPHEKFNFPGEIGVFGNKVALISLKPTYNVVIINNASIAETMKQFFKVFIESAGK